MRRWAAAWLAAATVAACHVYRMDPQRPAPVPPAGPAAAQPAAVPEFVPSSRALATQRQLAPQAPGGDGGSLIDGLRLDARGVAAADVAEPALHFGARVPAHLGAGFLFASGRTLYFARSFVAPLEPVLALPSALRAVSFGPSLALLHFQDGDRWALSPVTRRRVAFPVAGLLDAAALPDGRAVYLVEPNRPLTSRDGGRSWRDASTSAGAVTALHTTGQGIFLARLDGHASSLEPDGTLRELAGLPEELARRTPRVSDDPRWPVEDESPRDRAVRFGVPLDARTAVVEVAGAMARVDLATGALLSITPRVLTAPSKCELLPVADDILGLCRTSDGTLVVLSGLGAAQRPRVEATFPRGGVFYAGADGALVLGAACDGNVGARVAACARQRGGSWRELGEPEARDAGAVAADAGARVGTAAAPDPRNVVRWIPTADGGALALVSGPTPGLYDAARRVLTPFTRDGHTRVPGLFDYSHDLLEDGLVVTAGGSIVGYLRGRAVHLRFDGDVAESAHPLRSLTSAGPFALGADPEGRLWQSVDHGVSWTEVDRPPSAQGRSGVSVERCSRVGCELGSWLRLGFRPTPPAARTFAKAPEAPLPARPALPTLRCERTSAGRTRQASPALDANGEPLDRPDFGARTYRRAREAELEVRSLWLAQSPQDTLRGATLVPAALRDLGSAGSGRALGEPRRLLFTDAFGGGETLESRVTWLDVLRVMGRMTTESWSVPSDGIAAVPVLAGAPGETAGLLLPESSGVFLWVRKGQPTQVLALGLENRELEIQSAIVRRPARAAGARAAARPELVVLADGPDRASRVIAFDEEGPRVLFDLPPRAVANTPVPSALGVAADGSLAVVRVPSLGPPTADDPALRLIPRSHATGLAPWNSLVSADRCGDEPGAIRARLAVHQQWVRLELAGVGPEDEPWTHAIVRISPTRICLEAVEVGAGSISIGNDALHTVVSAHFAPAARAVRYGHMLGAEHSEPLSCSLVTGT